ncbi:hypothetical protein FAI40_10120 [Acetobacteraceae bacterium]|nr:hypothetical protein FAI40_10120 [Acetobacteraceae bacterium]
MARPTKYSPELVNQICTLIADGLTLTYICNSDNKYPDISTFWDWLNKYPEVSQTYARAREAQAEVLADQIIEEADKATQENANAVRIKVDARKWVAERASPKRWGNKQSVEHSGEIQGNISKIEMIVIDPPNGDTSTKNCEGVSSSS